MDQAIAVNAKQGKKPDVTVQNMHLAFYFSIVVKNST